MTNTVRRPRKRARKDSCAWTTFGWLLRRAAAFAMIDGDAAPALHPAWRRYFAESSSTAVERFYEHRARHWPARRYVTTFRG